MGKIRIISKDRGSYESTSSTWEYLPKLAEGDISENEKNIIIKTVDNTIADNIITINKEYIYANTPEFITYRFYLKYGGGLQILLKKFKEHKTSYELTGFYADSFKIKFEADTGFVDNTLNDPNFNPTFTKKQFLDGQELALLYQALMKELFAKPKKGYLLFETHNGGGNLYFDKDYFNELKSSIDEKFHSGKFAESNAEYEWIQLKKKIDNSENVINPNISNCRIYSVSL
ncbi:MULTISPECIES: hypothetical protein [unclassified Flavobacterium]|jgi:hypothetical protein|uniref:hypothetical protein n=1 Tax=unclassified Flavobacterium TaxID=196869 RepID=UPI0025C13061|nr:MULTISPECIES: hypothetical protein [unclassified Flavobacterium]